MTLKHILEKYISFEKAFFNVFSFFGEIQSDVIIDFGHESVDVI
jgi:hypothetical protein